MRWISSSQSMLSAASPVAPTAQTASINVKPPHMRRKILQDAEQKADVVAFVPLKDKTAFTHPSLLHTPKWNFEVPETVDGVSYAHGDYEKHVRFGETILEMILMEYLWRTYPRMSASGVATLVTASSSISNLASVSEQYRFAATCLLADPVALPALRRNSQIQANLLLSYVAGLLQQEGYVKARQWTVKVLRTFITSEYERLRDEDAMRSRPGPGVKQSETSRLYEWADPRKVEITAEYVAEGKPPQQTFLCRLSVSGEVFEARGETKKAARSSAASLALAHIDESTSVDRASSDERKGASSSAGYSVHSWKLNEYCSALGIEPEVSYRTDSTAPDYQFCTLRLHGIEDSVTARARGKAWARNEASKVLLQRLGVDISSLPEPTIRGTYTTDFVLYCQRNKFLRTFEFRADPAGDPEWFICRIEWASKGAPMRWVEERGRGKQEAKNNACKSALEIIGVSP